MADDKQRDSMLHEMAQHRGFRLVKSRRRKPGGDFGRFGLEDAASGETCLGFGKEGLTASAEEVEAFLRRQTASTWKNSLGAAAASARPARTGKSKKPRSPPPPDRKARSNAAPIPKERAKLRIREADLVDAEAIARLLTAFAPVTASELSERLPLLRREGEPPLVARLGEEVVGLVTWHVTPVLHRPQPVGRITFLEVDQRFRKQGIGRALVEAVEARLAERGCGVIEVTSNIKLTRAHKFYRSLGFARSSYRFAKSRSPAKPR